MRIHSSIKLFDEPVNFVFFHPQFHEAKRWKRKQHFPIFSGWEKKKWREFVPSLIFIFIAGNALKKREIDQSHERTQTHTRREDETKTVYLFGRFSILCVTGCVVSNAWVTLTCFNCIQTQSKHNLDDERWTTMRLKWRFNRLDRIHCDMFAFIVIN